MHHKFWSSSFNCEGIAAFSVENSTMFMNSHTAWRCAQLFGGVFWMYYRYSRSSGGSRSGNPGQGHRVEFGGSAGALRWYRDAWWSNRCWDSRRDVHCRKCAHWWRRLSGCLEHTKLTMRVACACWWKGLLIAKVVIGSVLYWLKICQIRRHGHFLTFIEHVFINDLWRKMCSTSSPSKSRASVMNNMIIPTSVANFNVTHAALTQFVCLHDGDCLQNMSWNNLGLRW